MKQISGKSNKYINTIILVFGHLTFPKEGGVAVKYTAPESAILGTDSRVRRTVLCTGTEFVSAAENGGGFAVGLVSIRTS